MEQTEQTMHELQIKYGTAKSTYELYERDREQLEQEWQECSELTLPYVFPDDDTAESDTVPSPFNSIGPSAVNSLASKLLLALLPPTGNFFRLLPNKEDIEGLPPEALAELDKELSALERETNELINIQALRVPLYEALKLLIITGNTLLYKVPNGTFKVFTPYQYVVQRDYSGEVLTIAIKEKLHKSAIDYELIPDEHEDETVCVYTVIVRESKTNFTTWQEVEGNIVESTIKSYKKDLVPYLPLRWSSINNYNYGKGLVQQYLGDLRSLEGLTQMIVEGGGIMAKTIFGLRSASTTNIDDLNNAENGDFIQGDLEKDVTVLQVNKGADMSIPFNLMQSLEQRLARAFLLASGQIRDSERTTATEIRMVANELESALGGTFSVLSQELQLPMLRLLLDEIEPEVLKVTTPSISTGISAISRERDFQNLNAMASIVAQFGPEVMGQYLKLEGYFGQIATALGIDPTLIVKTQEEIRQEQQNIIAMQQAQQGGMNG